MVAFFEHALMLHVSMSIANIEHNFFICYFSLLHAHDQGIQLIGCQTVSFT